MGKLIQIEPPYLGSGELFGTAAQLKIVSRGCDK
jgi:hypothetical protein